MADPEQNVKVRLSQVGPNPNWHHRAMNSTPALQIAVAGLTKRFGAVTAVDDLSFLVHPGRVTGFLGPNGAGKTTTLRCLLGLVTPTHGTVTIGGQPYVGLRAPIRTVGAALESSSFHPGRSARNHLRIQCIGAGIASRRADACLDLVGLSESANRRVGEYSLGMRQRLALAGALLGEPRVLVLDEPANGLDPAGIAWLRGFLRAYAESGATVLVSSHALAEIAATVDDVVIVARGRLAHAGPLGSLLANAEQYVAVSTPDSDRLMAAIQAAPLQAAGQRGPELSIERTSRNELRIHSVTAGWIGHVAFANQIELHELTEKHTDLEQVFLDLTADSPAPRADSSEPQHSGQAT